MYLAMPPFSAMLTLIPFSELHDGQNVQVPPVLRLKALAVHYDPARAFETPIADMPTPVAGLGLGGLGRCFAIRTGGARSHGSRKTAGSFALGNPALAP